MPLEDVVHRVAVDAELGGELHDLAAGLVRGDEYGLSVRPKAPLRLLRRVFQPHRVRRLGQIEEAPEAFYVVREVRIGLDKVHVCAFIHSV